jgi:hypothetical protein
MLLCTLLATEEIGCVSVLDNENKHEILDECAVKKRINKKEPFTNE